jgi:predicted transcriptional regulator
MNKSAQGLHESTTITVRVDRSVKRRLDAIARGMKRSKSFLASEAIGEYIAVQEWQIQGIKDGLVSLDRGDGIPHHEVERWLKDRRHV